MTPSDWAGFALAIASTLAIFIGGLRYLVRGWLWTLTPNGGSSMKDQLTRLEQRVDDLFTIISKR